LSRGFLPARRIRRLTLAAQTSALFGCHLTPKGGVFEEAASGLRGHLKKARVVISKLFPSLGRQSLPALELLVQKSLLFGRELLESRVILQHDLPLRRGHLPELFAVFQNLLLLLRCQSFEGLVSSPQYLFLFRCELVPLFYLIGRRRLGPRSDAAENQNQGYD